MLQHSLLFEMLAKEHQKDLLRLAEVCQVSGQVKTERCVEASLHKRMAARLGDLLAGAADQASFFKDGAIVDGCR